MKRNLGIATTLLLSAGALSAAPHAVAAADDGTAGLKQDGVHYLSTHEAAVKGAAADRFQLAGTTVSRNGSVHQRYHRTHEGLPVIGGDFVVHSAKGGENSVSVGQDKPIAVDTTPGIGADRALTAATAQGGKGSEPTLVVDARAGAPALAWLTTVSGVQADGVTPSRKATLVDAKTGEVRSAVETVPTLMSTDKARQSAPAAKKPAAVAAAGTGNGIFVGEVPIGTSEGASGFDMIDPDRGNNETCDMGNGQGACDTFTDADNAWGDGTQADPASAGVDAHYGASLTWDYFSTTFGRSGIFDDGQGVPSRVHYGDNYVNAFWDGQQMTYGDGSGNSNPLVALDVAGHEMSHGVTEATAGLEYSGDAGGLNEATSDVFGTMVEFSANNANDPGDYLIGEEIDINGDGSPLRYLDQPSKDGASFDCWSAEVPGSDPHYSSGVGNHVFYLLAQGSGSSEYGDSPTCDGSTVTGIGRDKAAAIWYTALRDYMTSTETYAEAKGHMVQAAEDLYGAGGVEAQTVEAAFTAVSVG